MEGVNSRSKFRCSLKENWPPGKKKNIQIEASQSGPIADFKEDEEYFGSYLLFEDIFATFAKFEDLGLLWLDSHLQDLLEMKVDEAIDPLNEKYS